MLYCGLFSRFVVDALECLAKDSAGGLASDWTHGCILMRLCLIHIELTSRRVAGLSSSGVPRRGCELGDAICARPVDETRMNRWVILLGVLAECQHISENKCRPNDVGLERARGRDGEVLCATPVLGNVPLLFLLIIIIVTFYSMSSLPIYLTCFCFIGRGHIPCLCRVVVDVSFGVKKRNRYICRWIEIDMRRGLWGGMTLIHAGRVEDLIPIGIRQL